MIPVFLAIAAALIAAVVISAKKPAAEPEPDILFCREDDGESSGADYDMLIGSLSSLPQLSVCLEHNFYHIPAKLVPVDAKKIRYVAVYQSRRFFGSEAAGVRYFAKVKNAISVPRYKISELPKKSAEMYVRFDVEGWQTRIKPIMPTAKGIVAGYTRFSLFETAEELPQLWLRNLEESRLYIALKQAKEAGAAVWGDMQVVCKRKSILLTQNRKLAAICTVKAFEKAPVKTVNNIIKQISSKKS